ncbi:hypothetical protein [Bullifex porci]|uniref:hypothetical protein n=1 Tax=Bullifex porci TaxID=2606638 RepID=UPI0023F4C73A|nr:hypothetical protein [Bullifex porci]MDD7588548.1 hypothetical protein [Bullifex porci]
MKFEEKKKNWMWDNGGGGVFNNLGAKGVAISMPKLQKFTNKCNACIENAKKLINQCVSKIVIHNLKQHQILNKRFT